MRIRAALVSTETGRPVVAVDVDLARALGGLLELLAGTPQPRRFQREHREHLAVRRKNAKTMALKRARPSGEDPPAGRPTERGSTPPGRSDVITLGPDEFHLIR